VLNLKCDSSTPPHSYLTVSSYPVTQLQFNFYFPS